MSRGDFLYRATVLSLLGWLVWHSPRPVQPPPVKPATPPPVVAAKPEPRKYTGPIDADIPSLDPASSRPPGYAGPLTALLVVPDGEAATAPWDEPRLREFLRSNRVDPWVSSASAVRGPLLDAARKAGGPPAVVYARPEGGRWVPVPGARHGRADAGGVRAAVEEIRGL